MALRSNRSRRSVALRVLASSWFILAAGCQTSPPPRAPIATGELSTAGMHRVPLTVTGQGQPLVTVTIRGKPVVMLVDTGATTTVLDLGVANALGIRSQASANYSMGVGAGRVAIRSGEITTFTLGGFDASVAPTLQDFSNITRNSLARGGQPLVGLLGFDVLRTYGAIIDIERGEMWLRRPR